MLGKYSLSHIKILEESSCREFVKCTFRCYFLHELKKNDYALCRWKRKTETWELKENRKHCRANSWYNLANSIDALEKEATSAYDKAEDSESDIHALVAQGNSLRQTAGGKRSQWKKEEAEKK